MLALTPPTVLAISQSLEGRSWVAFFGLRAPSGLCIKIEATKTLAARMRALENDSPFDTSLMGLIETTQPAEAARAIQNEYQAARLRGEWFQPVPQLLTFIDRGAQTDLKNLVSHLRPATDGTVSVEELAEHLGVSVPTIYRRVRDRQLPHYRVGRQIRFVLAEVLPHVRG